MNPRAWAAGVADALNADPRDTRALVLDEGAAALGPRPATSAASGCALTLHPFKSSFTSSTTTGRAGRDGRVADRAQRTRSGRRHHRAIAACGVRVARANTDTRRALARYDLCRPLERERRTVRFVNFRYHFVRGSMTQLIRNIREDPSLRAAFSPRAFPPRRVSRDDGHTTRASDTIHHTTLASDTT